MNQIRFYIDEDALQNTFVQALRGSGIDVITVADAGRLKAPDKDQLIWATQQKRVIYSFNIRDFYQLHGAFLAQGRPHSGIILVPQQRYSVREQLRGVLQLMAEKSSETMANQLIFLSSYIRSG